MKPLINYIQDNKFILESDKKGNNKKTTERADIKFTIWKEPGEKLPWLKENEPFQKIEYIYKNKEKNIVIDFLLGKKNNTWQLWTGKNGAVNYDDEPFYNLKESTFAKAIVAALDKVQELLEDVKNNPDNWVQFYINK